jgi:type IV pilus assembly protein PilX
MRQARRRQQGVALVIALVVLLVVTIVGVSGLQTTQLEETMATNLRDHDIAFQAAEVALLRGEATAEAVEPGDLAAFDDNANGLFVPAAAGATPRWEGVNWATDETIPEADADLEVAGAAPKFIVEHLGQVVAEEDVLNISNIGEAVGAPTEIFRVTARGTGGSANARVLLQTTYGKIVR